MIKSLPTPSKRPTATKTRMLDFSFGELALVVLVALVVVGPKDLPKVMRAVGKWFGQFKSIADDFRAGFKSAIADHSLGEVHEEIRKTQEEIRYIKGEDGNFHPTYDISDFIGTREVKVTPPDEKS